MASNKRFESIKVYKTILPFFKKQKYKIIIGSFLVLLNSLFSIISPWVLKIGIDDIKAGLSLKLLGFYAFLIILLTFINGVFRYAMRKILISLSRIFEYQLHNDIYEHTLKLPQSFFDTGYTGDVMSKITNDVHAVRMVAGPAFMYSMNTIFTSIFAISMMIKINPWLALYVLIPLPIISISIFNIGKKIRFYFSNVQEKFSEMSVKTQENLNGIREVKVFAREDTEIEEFKKINKDYVEQNRHLMKIYSLMHPFFVFLIGISALIILWIGGIYVDTNKISLGSFVAFNSYLLLMAWPAIALGWVLNLMQRGAASMKRINDLLEEPIKNKNEGSLNLIRDHKYYDNASIKLTQLHFAYDSIPVLADLNMQIHPHQTIAITGSTASGKSTLLKLILRRYDYQNGEIMFNNMPLKSIPIQDWLNMIGYVSQDSFLFSGTIENNLLLGTASMNSEFIAECMKIACIDNEVEHMPEKMKTVIGERGITLSGGQKQRLSLARALIRKPHILIFDDPFSQVDINTEYHIWNNLKNYNYAPIRIFTSQRIHSIRDADTICVITNGQITESGTHQELLTKKGTYYRLFQKQLIKEGSQTLTPNEVM